MANNLTNTVNGIDYNYTVNGTTTGSATAASVSAESEVLAAQITFTKTLSKQYADLAETVVITYAIENNTTGALTSVAIQDTLLGTTTFTDMTVTGGTLNNETNTISMTDPPATGTSGQVQVTFTIGRTTTPSTNLYSTTATANIAADVSPVVMKTSYAELQINAAVLTITKVATPLTSILEGNTLTYTITVTNSGNVAATIPAGKFVDTWTAGGFSTISVSDSTNFSVNMATNQITNTNEVTVAVGTPLVLTVIGSVLVPT